jgi:flavin reductase (DIM6/NTAB) family NADH-FMN oxidoreductase RutF
LASVVMMVQERSHCPSSWFFQGSHKPAIVMIS